MPGPRPSTNADAEAAARQAEFNEKRWVWVPDEREGYLAGWVIREEEEDGDVCMAASSEIRRVPLYALSKMNPPKFDRVDDIADLTYLNEASVVHNLRLRYGSGAIYTYSGLFLVAINPYQALPLYSDAIVHQYRGKRRDENPPHIFAIAERAWINMGEERENQSILITGESGAGKTESTKKVIQYLAAIATDAHPPSPSHSRSTSIVSPAQFEAVVPSTGLPRNDSFRRSQQGLPSSSSGGHNRTTSIAPSVSQIMNAKGRLGLLERQILQANPILEAFGNAQTQRNNNSSRFGKFIRISFSPDGSIAGANIDWYLLEKSRVVVRNEAERSFHVFYQLLEAGGPLRDRLLLEGGVENYEYLNKSRREVDGIDDVQEWKYLNQALETVGFSEAEQYDLFRTVAAVLHIGNIVIAATRADDALMPDASAAERVCHLLGIPIAEFTKAVLRPRVLAGREWVTQARTKQQALDELAALCKTLYERSFGRLVARINRALDRPSAARTFIGVLDIAGFEIFDVNGYEQLLINYTNERLQQFFNHHMFVLEQEEYAREGIEWSYVNFGLDLQPTIELIEATGSTIGILSCLDEECIMPKANDLTFTNKLHQLWTPDPTSNPDDVHPGKYKYEPARFEQGFLVQHYAGRVEYRTDGWLEKNKDPLNDNLTRVMAAASEPYVADLFADYVDTAGAGGGAAGALASNALTVGKKRAQKKGAFRTVAQRHKEQLASLMGQLQATQPHFVRCIVPNPMKKPGRIDVPLVLDQLRCNGVLEGIRIARLGYPNRLPFVEFRQRYEILTPGVIPRGYMDGRKACLRMVDALELDKTLFKIGTSKIFFKAGVLAELEERRDSLLFDVFARFQAMARRWTARRQMKKKLNRAIAVRTIQRNAKQYNELRSWPWWQLYTKVRPLLAATRNDDELRARELELALAKERAERDQKEKDALEGLKMKLEADKARVEGDLAAERALGQDKDALLERTKEREAELVEEVNALQADLDTLDSQLDRVLTLQKESDEKHEALKAAFEEAAEHLVRLEADQKAWGSREAELTEQLDLLQVEGDTLRRERDDLQKQSEELKNTVLQREEDLSRAKDRMDIAIADVTRKLTTETTHRDLFKSKFNDLEVEARQTKEQLAEMTRTANDYSAMLAKKEEALDKQQATLSATQKEKSRLVQEITSMRAEISTLSAELDAQNTERSRGQAARQKLQEELDELRSVLAAKSSDEARRSEVEKSMEVELVDLRKQAARLQQEASDARRQALEAQNSLRAAQDTASREYATLKKAHDELVDQDRSTARRLRTIEAEHSEAEKVRRSLETELHTIRSRQTDIDAQLSEALHAKDILDKQLAASHARYQDFEDAILQTEREKGALDRQVEAVRKELEAETAKRSQLEKTASSQRQEIATMKDRAIKQDRELNKALTDIKNLEWANKQLVSKQDKTIVEHVHVLEEAKRVTDRQLAEARVELEKQTAYIKSLEKAKARLANEAEDLARETERDKLENSRREKAVRAQEERAARAFSDAETERRAREAAELQVRRLQSDLTSVKGRAEEMEDQLNHVQKAKETLESELVRLADETPGGGASLAKIQRQYESRIASLEEQLYDADMANATAAKIRDQVTRQHAEIRKMIMSDGPRDETFRQRLLRELESVDQQMEREMKPRTARVVSDVQTFANGSPTKRPPSVASVRSRKISEADIASSERQAAAMRQQLQVMELQVVNSDRIRHHLESCLREMTIDLENSDGSKAYLEKTRARLSKENARLAQLIEEEAATRRSSEQGQHKDIQTMWNQFKSTIAKEQESYTRLEESRKALVVQQRSAQMELEQHRRQLREVSSSRKQLQDHVAELQDRLDSETNARNEEASAKRQLQTRLQELEITASTSTSMQGDLSQAVESFREKANAYQSRLEEAEIARAKSSRAEAHARRSLADAEKALAEAHDGRQAAEDKLQAFQLRVQEIEARLDDEGRESSELNAMRQQLAEEVEDERRQHRQDIEERDQAIESTQKRYQVELNRLMEELQAQRDNMSRLREENRNLRSDYDDLQLRYDDEIYSGGSWKKDRERLETKIGDLSQAYETSMAAQGEQQNQIVSLHSQVRELRSVLDEAEADRVLLHKARRALQAELESIKLDNADSNKLSSTTELQKLQLRKQDLERSVEEHRDKEAMAAERMRKAEARVDETQQELGRVRVENSELEKQNATLENKIKEFQVRIVDLETKSYQSSPRPSMGTGSRRMESRIAELTDQLSQTSRDKSETVRLQRSADKTARDAKTQLAESDRQRAKLEEEMRSYESRLANLRQSVSELETSESNLQLANRRAEREAQDYKQKALSLEREVERLRNSSSVRPLTTTFTGSPVNSPRKFA